MKRCLSILLAFVLFMTCVSVGAVEVYATTKATEKRTIAIVFDNSGSMYDDGDMAWCRATYAMEVFASMLNKGDTLMIYPMHPITVGKKEYTMKKPLKITSSADAATIRDIYTPRAVGTPIESIDYAVKGLKADKADKKYMIVLTDGEAFYRNGSEMSASETRKQLDSRFKGQAGKSMMILYLGIGNNVVMPSMKESEHFVKKQAKESEDVLSSLTLMCNQIFGRDSLPKNHLTETTMDFDISMNKLIVFVQGENVSDLKVKDANGAVLKMVSSASTKYGTAGCGNYKSTPDKSLQGMMVTYENCSVGNYEISYKGKPTSVEVYYEPDADLDFVFTDAKGNTVDPTALYEGDYKVSFGMKDGKTGKLIQSDLLAKPHYEGAYSINGKDSPIVHDGQSGEVDVPLKMDDTFKASLTVTYLSGYTITKDSTDFGWPAGGIKVAARPAGDMRLEISGGDKNYPLTKLEDGAPFTAKIFYQDKQLTGAELKRVDLRFDEDIATTAIKQTVKDDHIELKLQYKEAKSPKDTVCGKCEVPVTAFYAAKGSSKAQTTAALTYEITDDSATLQVDMYAPNDYIVISKLSESQPVEVTLALDGKPLTPEQFKATELLVDTDGLEHSVTPNEKGSGYQIQLLPTDEVQERDYPIRVTARYTDGIGRVAEVDDRLNVTMSNTPLWVKWLIGLLLLILLIFIIWKILHIRTLPSRVRHVKGDCSMSLTGKNVTSGTDFNARRSGKQLRFKSQYNGDAAGITISNIKPGKESYLYKRQPKRSILVDPKYVKRFGDVLYADINGVSFQVDKKEGTWGPEDPNQPPFMIANGASITYRGNADIDGKTKKFQAEIPITFRK